MASGALRVADGLTRLGADALRGMERPEEHVGVQEEIHGIRALGFVRLHGGSVEELLRGWAP